MTQSEDRMTARQLFYLHKKLFSLNVDRTSQISTNFSFSFKTYHGEEYSKNIQEIVIGKGINLRPNKDSLN